jgi:hypothetical protein
VEQNPTDLGLHYIETVRPVTDLVELYTIDESSGRLVKVISGDNLPFKRTYDNHKTLLKLISGPKQTGELFFTYKETMEI